MLKWNALRKVDLANVFGGLFAGEHFASIIVLRRKYCTWESLSCLGEILFFHYYRNHSLSDSGIQKCVFWCCHVHSVRPVQLVFGCRLKVVDIVLWWDKFSPTTSLRMGCTHESVRRALCLKALWCAESGNSFIVEFWKCWMSSDTKSRCWRCKRIYAKHQKGDVIWAISIGSVDVEAEKWRICIFALPRWSTVMLRQNSLTSSSTKE